MRSFGRRPAFVFTEEGADEKRSLTYQEFADRIEHWNGRLRVSNVQIGESVAVIGDYSPEVAALVFALVQNKNIIVPLTRETARNHEKFLSLSSVSVCFRFNANNDRCRIHRSEPTSSNNLIRAVRASNDPGLILFTSGTSGESKGAVLNVSRLLHKFKSEDSAHRPALPSLVFLKLDHIGGTNTLFSILLTGGTAVLLRDRTPDAVCKAISEHRVELLPATPTFLNILLISRMHEEYDLSSVRLITYGTEPMPVSTLNALNQAFPGVRFKQTYGLTELGILSTKSRDNSSLWMKIGGDGVHTRVVDGVLHIKTRTAMLGYLNAPSPFAEDGWYNTGDRVEVDGDYFKVLGRDSEVINVGGEKVFPAEVESVLLEIDNVEDALVHARRSPVTGEIVAAKLVIKDAEDRRDLHARVIKYCQPRLEAFKVPKLVQIVNGSFVSDRLKKSRSLTNVA